MTNYTNNNGIYEGKDSFLSFVVLSLIIIGGLAFIGPVLAYIYFELFSGHSLADVPVIMSDPEAYPEMRVHLLIFQGLNAFGTFILAPLIFIIAYLRQPINKMFQEVDGKAAVMVVLITLSFMIVNTKIIEWNQQLVFPEFLRGFEQWAKGMEEQLADLTKYLTTFASLGYFLLAMIVIAVIPAFGEELLFRGLLQNLFQKVSNNIHVAVWVSAFIFGVIHFQFYGVVPRILLGAIFGYLYAWTKNLYYPVIAHFVNNGLSLILLYSYQQGQIDYDIDSTESAPNILIFISLIIFIASMYIFAKNFNTKVKLNEGMAENL